MVSVQKKDNFVIFGYRMDRFYTKPTSHQKNPNICGISIKRDTLAFQVRGCGAVPQFRSKREVVILIFECSSNEYLISVPHDSLLIIKIGYN